MHVKFVLASVNFSQARLLIDTCGVKSLACETKLNAVADPEILERG